MTPDNFIQHIKAGASERLAKIATQIYNPAGSFTAYELRHTFESKEEERAFKRQIVDAYKQAAVSNPDFYDATFEVECESIGIGDGRTKVILKVIPGHRIPTQRNVPGISPVEA